MTGPLDLTAIRARVEAASARLWSDAKMEAQTLLLDVDIPALLDEVERLRKIEATARAMLHETEHNGTVWRITPEGMATLKKTLEELK